MSPLRKLSTLSRKSSLRNAASRFTRAWIVSLKLRVKGIPNFWAATVLVVAVYCDGNIYGTLDKNQYGCFAFSLPLGKRTILGRSGKLSRRVRWDNYTRC